jgi:hypothetical protein
MRRRGIYYTVLLAGLLGCTNTASTETDETSPEPSEAKTEALQAAAPQSDETSQPAIIVQWRDRTAERKNTQNIDIVVENTSDYNVQVDLAVVAADDGQAVTRAFDTRALKPHNSVDLAVPITLIPVQSAGADTAVWVSASYSLNTKHPFTNAQVSLKSVAISEARRITFADDFASAVSRDYRAQLAANDAPGNIKRVPVKRRFDAASARAAAVAPAAFTTSFRSIPAGAAGTPPVIKRKVGAP